MTAKCDSCHKPYYLVGELITVKFPWRKVVVCQGCHDKNFNPYRFVPAPPRIVNG